MTAINKRKGTPEEFNRQKLEKSITTAGVPENVAREIASAIDPNTTRTTDDIRRRVAEELRKRDPAVADRYELTRNLAARKAVDAAAGTAKLNLETIKALGASPGDQIVIEHHGITHTLRAEPAPVERWEMHLHENDLNKLGATDGAKLAARRGT